MSGSEFVWGIVLIGCGIFISVYGNMLFRFVLAAIGFAVGFGAAMALLDDQSTATRVIVALAVGGIAAVALYMLVRFGVYIAGGIFGAVLGLLATSLIDIFDERNDTLAYILVAVGIGLGGFFGPRLGDWIIVLASASAGAYLIVSGLTVLFESRIEADTSDPSEYLSQRLTLTVFLILCALSGLAQNNAMRIRRRFGVGR